MYACVGVCECACALIAVSDFGQYQCSRGVTSGVSRGEAREAWWVQLSERFLCSGLLFHLLHNGPCGISQKILLNKCNREELQKYFAQNLNFSV